MADEIGKVGPGGGLAAELVGFEQGAAQMPPDRLFRRGHVAAEFSGAVGCGGGGHDGNTWGTSGIVKLCEGSFPAESAPTLALPQVWGRGCVALWGKVGVRRRATGSLPMTMGRVGVGLSSVWGLTIQAVSPRQSSRIRTVSDCAHDRRYFEIETGAAFAGGEWAGVAIDAARLAGGVAGGGSGGAAGAECAECEPAAGGAWAEGRCGARRDGAIAGGGDAGPGGGSVVAGGRDEGGGADLAEIGGDCASYAGGGDG